MADEWASPTSHNDPSGTWNEEQRAYDENEANFAYTDIGLGWGDFLELNIASISCSKVRCWSNRSESQPSKLDLDVYYGGTWNHIFEDLPAWNAWEEYELGDTYAVTAVRVRYYVGGATNKRGRINEFDFWKVVVVVGRSFGYIIG